MADLIYNRFREYIGDGTIDLDTHGFKCGLLDSGHTPSATDDSWSDVSGDEVSGTGYTAGGTSLTNVTWTRSGADLTFDADNPTWTTATVDARYAVIYCTSTGNKLCFLYDFVVDKTFVIGTFVVEIPSTGIFTLT